MSRSVQVKGGQINYVQRVSVGPHVFPADEAADVGGRDTGPDPYELLLSALGSCVCITLRMYAERKGWPLEAVEVRLSYARVHANDCADCDGEARWVDGVEVELFLTGNLTEIQRHRLLEIAERCPVHRTLAAPIPIQTQLASSI